MNRESLEITTPSDREIAMKRVFDAPRRLVWDAHTRPESKQARDGVLASPMKEGMESGYDKLAEILTAYDQG